MVIVSLLDFEDKRLFKNKNSLNSQGKRREGKTQDIYKGEKKDSPQISPW